MPQAIDENINPVAPDQFRHLVVRHVIGAAPVIDLLAKDRSRLILVPRVGIAKDFETVWVVIEDDFGKAECRIVDAEIARDISYPQPPSRYRLVIVRLPARFEL